MIRAPFPIRLAASVALLLAPPVIGAPPAAAGGPSAPQGFYGQCMASAEVRALIRSMGGRLVNRRAYCRCVANYLAPKISTVQTLQSSRPPPSTLMARARHHCLPRTIR